MQRALFLLLAVSCGGKLDGQASDAGIGEDASDPLGGGGMMLKGPCRFGSAFRPRDTKMEWITLTKDNAGISTVSRAESPFTLVCSGKGSDGFYYAIRMTPVSAAVGVQAAMGDMYQSANGREAERAFGECTVDVRALGASMGKRTVDGSFDCPALFADPIGHFHLDGVFTVPLP